MTLTEEQKQAILEQSKGMTDTEKQKFAADIRAAQEREAAKQQQKQAAEASQTAFKGAVSNEKPKEDVIQPEEKTNAPTDKNDNNIASGNIPGITPEPTQAPAPIKKEKAPAVGGIPGVTSEAPYTGPITNIEEFKKAGGSLDNLSSLITNAYGAEGDVQIKGDTIYGTKNGKPTKWIIDDAGNPIATTLSIDEANKAGMGIEKLSSETIFKKLLNDEDIPSMYQDTSEYKVAKEQANKWKMLDKSEGGLYSAIKNGTLDNTLLNEIYNSPITKEAYDKANKRVIEEKIKNGKAEDVVNMTISELEQYVKNKNTSFYGKTFEERINENTDIATYKKQYLDGLEKASDIKVKIDGLKDNIRRRFPNATEGFINMMYKREVGALTDEYKQAVADANLGLGAYNFSIGEIEKLEKYEAAEGQKMEQSFNTLLKPQLDLAVQKEEYKLKEEWNEIYQKSNKKLTQKIDKDGNLVFFDNEGNKVKEYKGFSSVKDDADAWSYKQTDDGGYIGIKWNKTTGQLQTKSYTPEGNLIRQYGNVGNIAISEGYSDNIPDTNNNPFNVKSSPLAEKILGYKPKIDKQGHIIFNSPEDGLKVGLADIDAKINGRTSNKKILDGLEKYGYVSLETLGKGWAEHTGWSAGVASILGVSIYTDVKEIDKDKLAAAIAKQEGYTGQIKADENVGGQIGNDKWKKIKSKDYSNTSNLFLGMGTVEEIESLIDKTDVGYWRATSRKIGSFFPEISVDEQDRNFDKLSALTIDTLAQYIKSISGATVSDKERENLEKVLPTPKDNKETFKIKLQVFKEKMNNILTTEANYWGFRTIDDMKDALGINDGINKKIVELPKELIN